MKFIGRLPGHRAPITLQATVAGPQYRAVTYSATDRTVAANAANGNFYGHFAQEVAADQPSWQDLAVPQDWPKKASVGEHVTVEHWAEFEAEGANYLLLSGTGQIAANTAVNTRLTYFVNSGVPVLRIAQTGEFATHQIAAQLPPEDSGGVRIHVREITPALVA